MTKGYVYSLLTMLIWGMAPVFAKIGVRDMVPINAFMIRTFGVSLFLLIFLICSGNLLKLPFMLQTDVKATLSLFFEGFLGAGIGQITYYTAQKNWEASKVVIVASAFPVVALIMSYFILKEPLTARKLAGLALVLAGIYLVK